ncbi:MAG: amidase family protein, partial [Pseudomonadota bacterium]
ARARLVREWTLFFERWPVLLCPVSGELPFPDHDDVTSPERFAEIWEAQLTQVGLPLMGLPGLTVSTGMVGEDARIPMGVQLVGARYREDLLLKAGAEIAARGTPPSPINPNRA